LEAVARSLADASTHDPSPVVKQPVTQMLAHQRGLVQIVMLPDILITPPDLLRRAQQSQLTPSRTAGEKERLLEMTQEPEWGLIYRKLEVTFANVP